MCRQVTIDALNSSPFDIRHLDTETEGSTAGPMIGWRFA